MLLLYFLELEILYNSVCHYAYVSMFILNDLVKAFDYVEHYMLLKIEGTQGKNNRIVTRCCCKFPKVCQQNDKPSL